MNKQDEVEDLRTYLKEMDRQLADLKLKYKDQVSITNAAVSLGNDWAARLEEQLLEKENELSKIKILLSKALEALKFISRCEMLENKPKCMGCYNVASKTILEIEAV